MSQFEPWACYFEYSASRRDPHVYDAVIDFMPKGGGRILDAGCGAGRLAVQLAARSEFVIGLDLSPQMLALAQTRQAEAGLANIGWVQGDIERLPFQSASFDYTVSTGVLHLIDLDRVMPELKRMVKPGGRIALGGMSPRSPRWRFRISYLRRTLNVLPVVYAARGARPAWHMMAARLRHLPEHEKLLYTRMTPAAFRETSSPLFPGCEFRQEGDRILVLWEHDGIAARD